MKNSLVYMDKITVEFPGVKALDEVSFELRAGEVHILLGENGAGKSTLMKVLSGVYKKNSGVVNVEGTPYEFSKTSEAMEVGINIVYQELNLIPFLTVAENIFLGREPKRNGMIDWKKLFADADTVLKNLGVSISPKTVLNTLTVAQQQMVEIAKCVSHNSKVIIMDEPTSSLTEKEIDDLFRIIADLKAKNVGIVYISHRFEEIKRIGDRATIMRDGRFIDTVDVQETSIDDMISKMVGRELTDMFPKVEAPIGDVLLEAKNISTEAKVRDCSFSVRKGEVLGFAGLMGAGRTELMRALIGADPKSAGSVYLEGNEVKIKTPEDSVKLGIALLPEDRKHHGLVLGMSVRENTTLATMHKTLVSGLVSRKKENEIAAEYVKKLSTKTPHLEQKIKFLSGGNQQKVVISKWLLLEGKVIIFDEPTRGIDVGAKVEIYKIINDLAKSGMAVIMVSSELPEVIGMSDRILVMCEGEIRGEVLRKDATQEKVMYYATGGKN